MQGLIINQYSNTKLRKIIYSTDQFSRQLKSVAAYILRQRQYGSSTKQVTRMEVTINQKFRIKQRLVRNNPEIIYKRKPQVVYEIQRQCEIDIPRSTLRLSEIAYRTFFSCYYKGRVMAEDPRFVQSIYADEQLSRDFRRPYIISGILKPSVKDKCEQQLYKFQREQRMKNNAIRKQATHNKQGKNKPFNVAVEISKTQVIKRSSETVCCKTNLRPLLPEKITDSISHTESKDGAYNDTVSNNISTVGDVASRRESIMEPNTDREIVNARADSKQNTSVNFSRLGCVALILLLIISIYQSLHSQPKVFVILFIFNTCFNFLIFGMLIASVKLIRLGFSKL